MSFWMDSTTRSHSDDYVQDNLRDREWPTHPHCLKLGRVHRCLELSTTICCHVLTVYTGIYCLRRCAMEPAFSDLHHIIRSPAIPEGRTDWMTAPTETIPRWVQDTRGRSSAINFPSAALCLLGLVCIHVLGVEPSSYYGSTYGKATADMNCCELLRQSLTHRRRLWHKREGYRASWYLSFVYISCEFWERHTRDQIWAHWINSVKLLLTIHVTAC